MSTLLLLRATDPRKREATSKQRRHEVSAVVANTGLVLLHNRHRSHAFFPCVSRSSDAPLPIPELSTPPIQEKDLSTLRNALNHFANSYTASAYRAWKYFLADRRRDIQRRCVLGLYAQKLKIAHRTWIVYVIATKREAIMKRVLKRLANRLLLLAWLTWRAHNKLVLRGEALSRIARLSNIGKLWAAYERLKVESEVMEEPCTLTAPVETILQLPSRPLRSHCNCVHRLRYPYLF